MLGGIGMTELIIILVIVLMIFGVGKLPEVGSALGGGIRQLKTSMAGDTKDNPSGDEIKKEMTPEIQSCQLQSPTCKV